MSTDILPMTLARMTPARTQRGIALFIGLIFLMMLSLLALSVMKGTLLEMRMTTATAHHEQAFEASEAMRAIPEVILADHVFNRGWPASWGGSVPDEMFDLDTTFANRKAWANMINPTTAPSGGGLQNACGNLVIFYLAPPCKDGTEVAADYYYAPSQWDIAVKLYGCVDGVPGTCSSAKQITADVSVVRDGQVLQTGTGGAQAQGYASPGVGMASGGGALLFQVRSKATVPGNGVAVTIAQYKQTITH
ncbi:MAG: PilX N-terminal domain-containing pilus assembly protein [Rhodanobacter sp.]